MSSITTDQYKLAHSFIIIDAIKQEATDLNKKLVSPFIPLPEDYMERYSILHTRLEQSMEGAYRLGYSRQEILDAKRVVFEDFLREPVAECDYFNVWAGKAN